MQEQRRSAAGGGSGYRPKARWLLPPLIFLLLAGLPQCKEAARPYAGGFCSVGSEELNDAMDAWRDDFRRIQGAIDGPQNPQHEGRGNGVAPGALLDGVCEMAAMSRPLSDSEIDSFVRREGSAPVSLPVAIEALAIIVPAKSPLHAVSRQQLQQLYGEGPHILSQVFPELSANAEWAERDLSLHGLNTASDRYRWFKEALQLQNISDRVREESGPLTLADAVARSRHGFGYARPAELGDGLRMLALTTDNGAIMPDTASIQSGRYPLRRYFYIVLPPSAARAPSAATQQFLRYVLGAGQERLAPLGLYALAGSELAQAQQRLNDYLRATTHAIGAGSTPTALPASP
ncbi:MAG: substrate-binding domain-containing protein [Leptospirales bacterium]|nr:substrate-binding domain-containing protein [Leptospirales bacterium]